MTATLVFLYFEFRLHMRNKFPPTLVISHSSCTLPLYIQEFAYTPQYTGSIQERAHSAPGVSKWIFANGKGRHTYAPKGVTASKVHLFVSQKKTLSSFWEKQCKKPLYWPRVCKVDSLSHSHKYNVYVGQKLKGRSAERRVYGLYGTRQEGEGYTRTKGGPSESKSERAREGGGREHWESCAERNVGRS